MNFATQLQRHAPRAALVLMFVLLVAPASHADAPVANLLPSSSSDLFQTDKVWTLHLRVTAEDWSAMEPAAGTDMLTAIFGPGMLLTPHILREGDSDDSGDISAAEFRALGERWFAAWDGDADGILDSAQVREGLKRTMSPPTSDEVSAAGGGGPSFDFSLQGAQGKRNGLAAIMGLEFTQVHADVDFDGHPFANVALRYKGNGTFVESRTSVKRPLKVDLNKFVKGQKLAGVSTLNLHNNVTDAGMMNEVLAYSLYRDAGVPAPRTAYARVFVTVPGKHERRYFGLYSLVENIDKNFLTARGLDKDGAILKPSSTDLFAHLGDDWERYQQPYDPKTDLTEAQERRLIDFCRLVSKAGDAEFATRLGDFLDLDEFARYMAVSVWIGDYDSMLTTGQNFYMYLDPTTNRFQFIPWDKDHTFGSWIAGTPEDLQQHSILEPWEGHKRFLARTFKVDAFRDRYRTALKDFHEQHARPEQFEKRVAELAPAIRPAIQEELSGSLARFDTVVAGKPLPGALFGFGPRPPTLLLFVKARAASVADQLAGKGDPYVFGKPRPGAPPVPQFHPEQMIEPALVRSLDADKDRKLSRDEFVKGFARWFAGWDTEKQGLLPHDRIRAGLNKEFSFSGRTRETDGQPSSKQ